jgi:hypothetical protein
LIPVGLDPLRAVADAVLYEGYLLYPYRASSHKNQSRWQFGVLGPPRAAPASFGEEPDMETQVLLAPDPASKAPAVTVHLRFLQLQVREVQRRDADGGHTPVGELTVNGARVLSWDEAVEHELELPVVRLAEATDQLLSVPGGEDTEPLAEADGTPVGRIVRRRAPLNARVRTRTDSDSDHLRLTVSVENTHADTVADKDGAIRVSFIGTHLLLQADGAAFVSLLDPPADAAAAAARCRQRRCWPVLAGPEGTSDTVLGAPIILYDHPEVAEQSAGALFDSTEIDEILTLRVMTMTEEEKAEARATDPRAREIIERCDGMSAAQLQQLHGLLRDPGATLPSSRMPSPEQPRPLEGGPSDLRDVGEAAFDTGGAPWWDPAADASVCPDTDAVVIDGVSVAKGSLVRVHPSRRADAQDLFFAGQVARVTAVLSDVEGAVHVALVLVDDPASDKLEPLRAGGQPDPTTEHPIENATEHREESRS